MGLTKTAQERALEAFTGDNDLIDCLKEIAQKRGSGSVSAITLLANIAGISNPEAVNSQTVIFKFDEGLRGEVSHLLGQGGKDVLGELK